jgi:hypothetical protein
MKIMVFIIGYALLSFILLFGDDVTTKPQIGKPYEGGIVFCINDDGSGIVAAKHDQGIRTYFQAKKLIQSSISIEGFTGWRLPSRDELNLIYLNLFKRNIGNITRGIYWAENELEGNMTWVQYMGDGYSGTSYKEVDGYIIRLVRDFN